MRSISDLLDEKLRYLQLYMMGGHALRICTSAAPESYRKFTVSRSWVPRTMESSTNKSFLSRMSSGTGTCFMFAILLRKSWLAGMNERGQVGVYLIKGRPKGMPLSVE